MQPRNTGCCDPEVGIVAVIRKLPCKVAEDGKAYSASQFHEFFRFKGDWLSKWNAATWATQRRIAEDGKVYTVDEFAEHYKSEWQQKLRFFYTSSLTQAP